MSPLDISADQTIMPIGARRNRSNTTRRCPQVLPKTEVNDSAEVLWYPVRVTYCREMALKRLLDSLSIENFIPMRYTEVVRGGRKHRKIVPAIHNLIFVHTSREVLQALKPQAEERAPMRYMMDKSERRPLTIPEKQMQDFIRVTSTENEDVIYLENPEFAAKVGEKVRITGGIFEGIEGKILRIKSNRKVVVEIEGLAAVAIGFVPTNYIERIN